MEREKIARFKATYVGFSVWDFRGHHTGFSAQFRGYQIAGNPNFRR